MQRASLASLLTLVVLAPPIPSQDERDLIGGCVQPRPVAKPTKKARQVRLISKSKDVAPLDRMLYAYGIILAADPHVDDVYLRLVGRTIQEMFRPGEGIDSKRQDEVIRRLHLHRALLPVVGDERRFRRMIRRNEDAFDRLRLRSSLCDIVMADVPRERQVMEVLEHVLHTITDVGLHHAYPREWGLTRDSELWKAMQRAIALGIYDVHGYRELERHESREVYDRVLMQEFAYWYLTTLWDLQTPYGPREPEWTVRNPAELRRALPAFHAVHLRTTARTLSPPTRATLKRIGPEHGAAGRHQHHAGPGRTVATFTLTKGKLDPLPKDSQDSRRRFDRRLRAAWQTLPVFLPKSTHPALSRIHRIRITTGEQIPPGSAGPLKDDPHGPWELTFSDDAIKGHEIRWVMVHELAHVLSLGDPDVTLTPVGIHDHHLKPTGPRYGEFFRRWWLDTGHFAAWQRLNPTGTFDPEVESRVIDHMRKHARKEFATEAAMVSPEEDFAETFAAYVLKAWKRNSGHPYTGKAKIAWFEKTYPR